MSRLTQTGLALAILSPALLAASCPPMPTPQCPAPPAVTDRGPIPPMAGRSSVDIELSRLYVIERVRAMLEQPQGGDAGAYVRSVDLKELPVAGGPPRSVLQVRLEPWLKGQGGQPASLQRSYRLTLRITPHLVTPATVLDPVRRRQLLCPASEPGCTREQGVWLTFDLHELENVSFGRPACTTPDLIDAQVVPEIFASVARQAPLALPTDAIAAVLASAAGAAAAPTDVVVSADGFLKIGLRFAGPDHAFDRVSQLLSRYPGRDWMVDIDTGILAASVRASMLAGLQARAAGATLNSFSATFQPGEIRATGVGSVGVPGICGTSATVNIGVRAPTQVCRDGGGASTIVSWQEITDGSPNVCVNLKKFWDGIGVGIISGPPLVWPVLATVTFPAGDDDVFYGTDLDLDGAFAIVGRSTVMDRKAAAAGTPRPVAPGKCPGVP